jgi:hypothetical protein
MSDRPQARTEGIVTEWVDDGLVIYDQLSQTAHSLSAAAAMVWGACDGQLGRDEIAERVSLDPAMVERALEELSACGLLEGDPVSPPGYSRREAAKKAAKVGGLAFAAPLIYSVAVPTSAMAAGGSCIGQPATGCTAASGGQTGTSSACGCTAANGHCYLPPSGVNPVCAPSGCGGELASAPHCTAAPATNARDAQDCCSGCCRNIGVSGSPNYVCAGTMTC